MKTIFFYSTQYVPQVEYLCKMINEKNICAQIYPQKNKINVASKYIFDRVSNINYEKDYIIYTQDVFGNPCDFKNVIRLMLDYPEKNVFETYCSSDMIISYAESFIKNIYQYSDIKILHPDIIDFYDELSKKNIIAQSISPEESINYLDHKFENSNLCNIITDIISQRENFSNVRFTDPILNIFNNLGIQYNTIKLNSKLKEFTIYCEFQINTYNFEHENMFDLNYGSYNCGPRLEINKTGDLGFVIGTSASNFVGTIIEKNIALGKKYFLQINILEKKIIFNINNIISSIQTNYTDFDIGTVSVSGGFDNSRLFSHGILYNFKLYNYCFDISPKLNLCKYDVFKHNYPVKIYQTFFRYDTINLNYTNTFNNITITGIMQNICPILLDIGKNITIFNRDNICFIKIYGCEYNLFNMIPNNQNDFIVSIDNENKLICCSNNNNIRKIILNNTCDMSVNFIKLNTFIQNFSISNYNMNNELMFHNENINCLVNRFNTFGFIKVNNLFISKNEKLIKMFEYNTVNNSKNILDYIPNSMEYLNDFLNIILNNKIHNILKRIFNKPYYYNGSDSKIYSTDTNWHCDRTTNNLHIKCAFYLDKLNKNNGCLRVMPGSQNKNDIYKSILDKKCIPLYNGPGGFQKDFFEMPDLDLPCYEIDTDFGDFLIFNLSLFHAAFYNHVNKKMICMNFAEEYDDNNDPEKIECINSDYGIIGNLRKNVNKDSQILIPSFLNYIKNTQYYNKYFKSLMENNNSLNEYIKLLLDGNTNTLTKINDDFKNTNNAKTNKHIIVYNNTI